MSGSGHHQHREQIGAGREHRAGNERQHDRVAAELAELRRSDHPEPGQDDDDERQLEREAQRQDDLQHEAEVVVVGDERRDRLGLEAEEHPQRLRHDEVKGERRADEEQQGPTKSAGTRAFFSRAYSAGARKAQSCQRMTGEASTSPTRKPSLKTIITGSVGLVTISFPSGRYGAIGGLSRLTS